MTSIVNAIGESNYWNTSAIVIIWDDWGGWFDNAPPPQLDFRGLAMRVPCLIISPYARKGQSSLGYISHTQYEFGSILRFIEQAYNLPNIGLGRRVIRIRARTASSTVSTSPSASALYAIRVQVSGLDIPSTNRLRTTRWTPNNRRRCVLAGAR